MSKPETLDFAALYDAHAEYLWRVLQRVGVPAANVEDAVQEVFIIAFRKYAEFEGRSSVKTWLTSIALRVARDHRDKRAAMRTDIEGVTLESAAPTPSQTAERKSDLEVLDLIFSELEESKRTILVLAEIEEMSVPEISRVLEINVNTAYSRLTAARTEFEAAVKRYRAKERRHA